MFHKKGLIGVLQSESEWGIAHDVVRAATAVSAIKGGRADRATRQLTAVFPNSAELYLHLLAAVFLVLARRLKACTGSFARRGS